RARGRGRAAPRALALRQRLADPRRHLRARLRARERSRRGPPARHRGAARGRRERRLQPRPRPRPLHPRGDRRGRAPARPPRAGRRGAAPARRPAGAGRRPEPLPRPLRLESGALGPRHDRAHGVGLAARVAGAVSARAAPRRASRPGARDREGGNLHAIVRRRSALAVLAALLLLVAPLAARAVDLAERARTLVGADQGVYVEAGDGTVLVAQHAARAVHPASVSKIPTTLALLRALGPEHRFETRFAAGGALRDGRIDGPLLVS